jgi:hypothetical protein
MVDDTICYLNTDLDLTSMEDLTSLAAAMAKKRVHPLHTTLGEDGLWYATFEVYRRQSEPERDIADMLKAIESLEKRLRKIWLGCSRREFNIGYDCGSKPWAFNQGLSNKLLTRIAAASASLRITIYPPAKDSVLVKSSQDSQNDSQVQKGEVNATTPAPAASSALPSLSLHPPARPTAV